MQRCGFLPVNEYPDLAFQFDGGLRLFTNADPDMTFHLDADPDPHESDKNKHLRAYRPSTAPRGASMALL